MTESTAIVTVSKETLLTLDFEGMTAHQLAPLVVEGCRKMSEFIPVVQAFIKKCEALPRDSKNRFKEPIEGCYSIKEFFTVKCGRTPQTMYEHISNASRTKITKADLAKRAKAKLLQARIDSDARAVADDNARRKAKAEGDTNTRAAVSATVQPQYEVPVRAAVLPTVNAEVAKRDADDLAAAVKILRTLVFSLGGRKKELNAAKGAACKFLRAHGGLQVPPPLPPAKKASRKRKPGISRAAIFAAALKNEPSQATPFVDVMSDPSVTVRGINESSNAKGTGATMRFATEEEHAASQRAYGLAL